MDILNIILSIQGFDTSWKDFLRYSDHLEDMEYLINLNILR